LEGIIWGGINIFGKFYKKQFCEFYAKTVVNNDFWSTPLEKNFFKTFSLIFVNVLDFE